MSIWAGTDRCCISLLQNSQLSKPAWSEGDDNVRPTQVKGKLLHMHTAGVNETNSYCGGCLGGSTASEGVY